MKHLFLATVFALSLLGAGCGNGGNHSAINGTWSASLSNPGGAPTFSFTTNLNSTSGNNVTVTNLTFTTQSPCFTGGTTATGSFTLTGTTNGVTSGGFQMNVQSTGGVSNTLALNGTLTNNTIAGTWTLTGSTSGCTGSGSFTMNKM